jgi:hypothetical protein
MRRTEMDVGDVVDVAHEAWRIARRQEPIPPRLEDLLADVRVDVLGQGVGGKG